MQFIIELSRRENRFRLTKNKKWRRVTIDELADGDYRTPDLYEIIKIQNPNDVMNIEGKKWRISPYVSSFGDTDILHYNIKVLRNDFPLIPSKEQLIEVIKQGDDRYNNSLILNIFGFYELRYFSNMNITIADPTIVYRNETYCAGNDYVGIEASKDIHHINKIYKISMEFWLRHLQTNNLNYHSDMSSSINIDDIIHALNELKENFENLEDI